jgi:hypothetical protein
VDYGKMGRFLSVVHESECHPFGTVPERGRVVSHLCGLVEWEEKLKRRRTVGPKSRQPLNRPKKSPVPRRQVSIALEMPPDVSLGSGGRPKESRPSNTRIYTQKSIGRRLPTT